MSVDTADAAPSNLVLLADTLRKVGRGSVREGKKAVLGWIKTQDEREHPKRPAAKPPSVRLAGVSDEQAIFDLLMQDVEENAAHVAVPSIERIMGHITLGTRRQGGIIGVIDGPGGKPVAVCVLAPCQWWWSNSWYVQEIVCYVHPDHRQSAHIDDLLEWQKWISDCWSESWGYTVYLVNGVLGTWRVMPKVRLYQRKFWQAGAAFIYPPPDVKGR